jgi:type IV pilus assembly protein PilB
MRETRKRIGEVLIQSGVLTKEQLDKALEIQNAGAKGARQKRRRLGKILVELSIVSEDQLAQALSLQLDLPRIDLGNTQIPDDVIQLVSREAAESNVLIPYAREGKKLMVAMADPLDFMSMDDLRFRTGLDIYPAVTTESILLSAIEKFYKVEETVDNILRQDSNAAQVEFVKDAEEEMEAPQTLQQLSQAAPIVKLVTTIVIDAIRRRATDIHIEPRESHVQVRYRVDGNLQDALKLPKRVQASVVSRIKILGNMNIANRMTPQDGSTKMRYETNQVDLRISTLPAVFGEKVVIRILDRTRGLQPLPKLGVPDTLIKKLQEEGSKSQGMIIVTGPTGSGKTTTLYAFLQWMQDPAINIITVEDPVEYNIPGITQVCVREQAGLGFPAFMRSALRQDPDIILVGEVRDLETAEIAIRAALTGHFVLTTLHTNDTVATVLRLIDLGVQPFLVSSAVSGIVAQRLVRRICNNCKTEIPFAEIDLPPDFPRLHHCYKGRGCSECEFTGFRGQVGIYEYLDVNAQLKRLIANNASESVLREEAIKMGLVTLFQDAWHKVAEGVTTVSEVMGKVPYYGLAVSAPLAVPPAPPQPPPLNSRGSVILVDGSAEDSSLFESALSSQGYRIITGDWPGAYEMVLRENPQAIVLNLDGPLADWDSLARRLQRNLSTITIPFFLLKSNPEWSLEMAGLKGGAAGVLGRPLKPADLLARLEEALGQEVAGP